VGLRGEGVLRCHCGRTLAVDGVLLARRGDGVCGKVRLRVRVCVVRMRLLILRVGCFHPEDRLPGSGNGVVRSRRESDDFTEYRYKRRGREMLCTPDTPLTCTDRRGTGLRV